MFSIHKANKAFVATTQHQCHLTRQQRKRTMTTPPKPCCSLFAPSRRSISIPMLLSLLHKIPHPRPARKPIHHSRAKFTKHWSPRSKVTSTKFTAQSAESHKSPSSPPPSPPHQCPQTPTPSPPGTVSNAASTSNAPLQAPKVPKSGPSCTNPIISLATR